MRAKGTIETAARRRKNSTPVAASERNPMSVQKLFDLEAETHW
jgi:hypothetical protein